MKNKFRFLEYRLIRYEDSNTYMYMKINKDIVDFFSNKEILTKTDIHGYKTRKLLMQYDIKEKFKVSNNINVNVRAMVSNAEVKNPYTTYVYRFFAKACFFLIENIDKGIKIRLDTESSTMCDEDIMNEASNLGYKILNMWSIYENEKQRKIKA